MVTTITMFLIKTLGGLYSAILTLRLLARLHGGNSNHPAVRQLVTMSVPLTRPFNILLPVVFRLETGTLTAILLLSMLTTIMLSTLANSPIVITLLLPWSLVGLGNMICTIYFLAILIQVVISWVAPYSQNAWLDLANQIAHPLCAPFRRIMPAAGGIDFSPLFVIIAINIAQIVLSTWANDLNLPTTLVLGI